MSELSRFQKYWINLKATKPDVYETKLKQNRERAKAYRKRIRDDPEKNAIHNAKRREYYRNILAKKLVKD